MQILGRLLNNCREPDRRVGEELGVTGGAVNARVKKLQRCGVIERFAMKIEPPALGYGVFYVVVTGRDHAAILEQVRLVGEPFMIVPCVGGITVCGIAVRDDVQQRIRLAEGLMRDVRVLSIFEAESPGAGADLTRTDLAIVGELIQEPRQRIESVARTTGLSTKTIARSIRKLQDSTAVQFTLVYDPTRIDGYIPYVVLAWIAGDATGALEELRRELSESFLQIPFVAKNQIVLFMYSDNIFKLDEITQRVRDMPDVETADLFIPKRIIFPQEWIRGAVDDAARSPTLHLARQTS